MASPSDVVSNLLGTWSNTFFFGKNGPLIKNNSGVLEARNSGDSAYALMRGSSSAVGPNDLITKQYFDTATKPVIVSTQMDGGSPPAPSGAGYIVVTTAGGSYAIGDIVYDDGTSLTNLGTVEGRAIFITDALSGGTITFQPDSLYLWDADGGSWVRIGDIGSVTGAVRAIEIDLDNSATQDSVLQLPAGSRVLRAWFEASTAYSGGATVEIGDTATADKFMGSNQNNPQQTTNPSEVIQRTEQAAASVVRVTVTGTPAAGAGTALIEFTVPNA